jgi:type IV secretory pathway VirB4 component
LPALKKHQGKEKGLSDLLNEAALVDDGIVLNKDGSLAAGWFYRGPDFELAVRESEHKE